MSDGIRDIETAKAGKKAEYDGDKDTKTLEKVSMMTFLVIALHNIPEVRY